MDGWMDGWMDGVCCMSIARTVQLGLGNALASVNIGDMGL